MVEMSTCKGASISPSGAGIWLTTVSNNLSISTASPPNSKVAVPSLADANTKGQSN